MESGFGYRFYNAGKRIRENFRFTISESSQGKGGYSANDNHGVGYWVLDAPEKGWFDIPAEVDSGTETVRVNFRQDVTARFGVRGVVLLNPRYDASKEDPEADLFKYPYGATEEAAIERAEKLWELYTLSVIERHLADADQALAAGGRPRMATGFTKFCFRLHGKVDPGNTYAHTESVRPTGQSSDVQAMLSAMQAQQATLTAALLAMASGEKFDPALLVKMTQTAAASPTVEAARPVTSGIATGKISHPIENSDGWVKAKTQAQGKAERGKQAADAL